MKNYKLGFFLLLLLSCGGSENSLNKIKVNVLNVCINKSISKRGQLEKSLYLNLRIYNATKQNIRIYGESKIIHPSRIKIIEASKKQSFLIIDNSNTIELKRNSSLDLLSNISLNPDGINEVVLYWDFFHENEGLRGIISDSTKIKLKNVCNCK